jgi:hypothetical protein
VPKKTKLNAGGKIEDRLFVNPALTRDLPNAKGLIPLSEGVLLDRIKRSREIVIISAYYEVEFLRAILDRKGMLANKRISMVFAAPAPSALPDEIPHLRKLQLDLAKTGKRANVNVAISDGRRFLHTKLYLFRRNKWVRTFIGSANATSNGFVRNDEILVEIHGRNSAIDRYVHRTLETARNCTEVEFASNEKYSSFEMMLRDGFVYFKPTRSVPETLNCFDNKPDIAEALQKAIVDRPNPLPGHEGGSFGMLNLLRLLEIKKPGQWKDRQRVTIASFSIETAFGYWVPSPYQPKLTEKLNGAAETKAAKYLKWGSKLSELISKRDGVISDKIRNYLSVADDLLESTHVARLSKQDKIEIETRIRQRMQTLEKKLSSEAECRWLARSFDGVPVPEIWEDPRSKNEMIDSYCEYLASKLVQRSSRMRRIVQKLSDWFELQAGDESESIRKKIEGFFRAKSLSRSDWTVDTHSIEEGELDDEEVAF